MENKEREEKKAEREQKRRKNWERMMQERK